VLIRAQPRPPVGAFSFLIVVLAAMVIAACGGGAPGRAAGETGASGTPSAGAPPAHRIVSLAPNITEILFALGLGDRVVGVTEFCNYPPEALRLPKVGGFVNPNAEVILALRPDLVVATPNVGNRTFVERLIAVGARVVVVQARNVSEIDPAIEAIAKAAGDPEAGSTLVARLHADLDRETVKVASLPRKRTLFCIQIEPLVVAGRGSYPGDLIELAGGENIVPATAGQYPTFSLEAVVAAAPEVIVQSLMDTREGAAGGDALMTYWKRVGSVPAVAKKRVFTVPGDVVLRPGPRVAEGVAALAALLHPEAAAMEAAPSPAPAGSPEASK
jgi:iron complex transport system substrate-binding protein